MRLHGWSVASDSQRAGLRVNVACFPGAYVIIALLLLLLFHNIDTNAYVINKQTSSSPGIALRDRTKRSKDVRIPASGIFHNMGHYPNDPYRMGVVMKPVSVMYFTKKLHEAKSYHDVFRIFYGDYLSNDVVENMIASPDSQTMSDETVESVIDSTEEENNDVSPFGSDRPISEGSNHSPVYGVHCESCDTSIIRTKRKDMFQQPGGMLLNTDTSDNKRDKKRHRRKGNKRKSRRKSKKKANRDWKKAFDHLQEVEARKECKYPKPELIPISDISDSADTIYSPECTIVHRCRKTDGCCNATSTCGPKTTQKIKRYFYVYREFLDGDKQLKPERNTVQSFTFTNHTECECKPIKQIEKCLECPFPFFLRRDGTECSCDCFDGDKNCIKIKRGRKPLNEKDISCIVEGNCHKPNCPHGGFNMQTGYCPKNKKHRRKSRGHPKHEEKDKASGEKPPEPEEEADDSQVLTLGEGKPLQADLSNPLDHNLGVT